MAHPQFLSSFNARTALETPQIVLEWSYTDPLPSISGVEIKWDDMEIYRSTNRYPEVPGDGVLVHTSAYGDGITAFADVAPVEDEINYYSAFVSYRLTDHATTYYEADLSRMFSQVESTCTLSVEDTPSYAADIITRGTGLASTFPLSTFTDPTATFLTDGVCSGHKVYVTTGPNYGTWDVLTVDSETQVTVVGSPVTVVSQDYVISKSDVFPWPLAVAGKDYSGRQVISVLDSASKMFIRTYVIDGLLLRGERFRSIAYLDDQSAAKRMRIVTTRRYIEISGSSIPEVLLPSHITTSWALSSLTPGHKIAGSAMYYQVGTGALDGVIILDDAHKEVKRLHHATGALLATHDLSGLEYARDLELTGIAYNGDGVVPQFYLATRYLTIGIDGTGPSPSQGDVLFSDTHHHAADVYSNFGVSVDTSDSSMVYRLYGMFRGPSNRIPNVSDRLTLASYHCDSASPLDDSTDNGYTLVNVGMTNGPYGMFGDGFRASAVGQYLDATAAAPSFGFSEGSVSLRVRSTTTELAGSAYLFRADIDANNYVRIRVVSGALTWEYMAGGVLSSISAPHPSPDAEYHEYRMTWSQASSLVSAFVDGSPHGVPSLGIGPLVGAPSLISIGGGGVSDTLLGDYDEIQLSAMAWDSVVPESYQVPSGRGHAYSGVAASNRVFNYRDHVFTDKFMGGDWMIRNDYSQEETSQDVALPGSGELVYRQPPHVLGDLGRLSRLLGLFLDRLHDDRERMIVDVLDLLRADSDYLPDAAGRLGVPGLEDSWNVDQQRRYVRFMRAVMKSGGKDDSYHVLSKLLGFKLAIETEYARRYLDSVVDPLRPDAPFDTQAFDTSDPSYPLVRLIMTWWQRAALGVATDGAIVGATTNRMFSSAALQFPVTAQQGSLLRIFDSTTKAANGDYRVVSVVSPTEILVDRDFPAGSAGYTSLTADINWRVPVVDAYTPYLLERMLALLPAPFAISPA